MGQSKISNETLAKLLKEFMDDAVPYVVEGVPFEDILSEKSNIILSDISHHKEYLLVVATDEPNLLFLIGSEDDDGVVALCYKHTFEKHRDSIKKLFPKAEIEEIERPDKIDDSGEETEDTEVESDE